MVRERKSWPAWPFFVKKIRKKLIMKKGNQARREKVLRPERKMESKALGGARVTWLTTRMEKIFFPMEEPLRRISLMAK